MLSSIILATVLSLGGGSQTAPPELAQVQMPSPPSPVDGRWFFRGNPYQPCSIQSVMTPAGPRLVFINEKGTSAEGWLSQDGRQVTIPDWNLTGTVQNNAIVWPNGDFWGR